MIGKGRLIGFKSVSRADVNIFCARSAVGEKIGLSIGRNQLGMLERDDAAFGRGNGNTAEALHILTEIVHGSAVCFPFGNGRKLFDDCQRGHFIWQKLSLWRIFGFNGGGIFRLERQTGIAFFSEIKSVCGNGRILPKPAFIRINAFGRAVRFFQNESRAEAFRRKITVAPTGIIFIITVSELNSQNIFSVLQSVRKVEGFKINLSVIRGIGGHKISVITADTV